MAMTGPLDLSDLIKQLDAKKDNMDSGGAVLPDHAQQAFAANLDALTSSGWSDSAIAAADEFWRTGTAIAAKLGLRSSVPHLLVNGRLVGPLTPETFPVGDFDVLEVFEHRKRVKPIIDLLKTMYEDITAFDRYVWR